MLKRLFWLLVLAGGGVLLWQWMRQRENEIGDRAPHFAQPHSYAPERAFEPPAATAPRSGDPDEALAPAAPGKPAAAVDPQPAFATAAPEAAPATTHQQAPESQHAGNAALASAPPQAAASVAAGGAAEADILGYCMRCHAKRPIAHAQEEISESGRRAARGTCPVCGTNMFTFLAANNDERGVSETRS